MSHPIRCIHVGVQRRGELILRRFASHAEKYRPVALVDATAELARERAPLAELSESKCFGSLEEAVARVDADAVIITSPARFHAQQIALALEHNLHVFVAKPMCYNLDQAIQLVEEAERRKRCLLVDQQQRFTLTERHLAELVATRRYGDLGFVSFTIHRYRPEMGAFTSDNPFIWEQGVHSFDSLLAIIQQPATAVQATQGKPPWSAYNGPTVSMGQIEFGRIPCHYLGTFESRVFSMEIRLEFEQGAVRAVAVDSWTKSLEFASPGGTFTPLGMTDTNISELEDENIEAFHRGCTAGGRQVNDGRENLRTLAITDAFVRSSNSGNRELVREVN